MEKEDKIEQIDAQIANIYYKMEMARRRCRYKRVSKLFDEVTSLLLAKYAILGIFPIKYQKYISDIPVGVPGPSCRTGPLAPNDRHTQR